MAKKVLISGGSGLIGKKLSNLLVQKGYIVHVLSRSKRQNQNGIYYFVWNVHKQEAELKAFKNIDIFIHLAGASIAEGRWTSARKQQIIDSRVNSMQLAFDSFSKVGAFPPQVISASGIGFYGAKTTNQIFKETDQAVSNDFAAQVCQQWEAAAQVFQNKSIVSILRTGIVLSKSGGALPVIAKPIRFFAGAALGSGKQIMPWIHINDLCALFFFVIDQNSGGIFNAVTDNASNKTFSKTLAKILKRPLWPIHVPAFVLKIILGEQAELVLEGSAVSSKKIKQAGFSFEFKTLEQAFAKEYQNL